MYVEQTANSTTLQLKVEVVKSGTTVDTYTYPLSWTYGLTLFKILRYNTNLYFYANGSLIFTSKHFLINASYYKIYSYNETEAYDISNINGEEFFFTPFVVFDGQVDDDPVSVSATRLRGVTPPSLDEKDQAAAYAGLVDITICCASCVTAPDAFEYYFVEKLKLEDNRQSNVRLSIIDDDTVITPEGYNVGLGEGK
jgi:disulfide oxidoreductase YuzD